MKVSKFIKVAIFTGLITTTQVIATPGRYDDINKSSTVEIGETITRDQEQSSMDALKGDIQHVIETQNQFLKHWTSQGLADNTEVLRSKIGAAMVGFQVAELMDKVNQQLGEEAYRPYTPKVEEINTLLKQVVKLQQEIDEFEGKLKLEQERRFYKNKLLFPVPLN